MSRFGNFAAVCAAVMGGVASLFAVEQVSPGTGDDAAAITAAIAAAAGEGGDGVVQLAPGIYTLTAQVEVDKQKGLSEAEVAGIKSLAVELGDPQAALSFFLRETNRDIETAKAYAGSLHEVMGNVTVYGDAGTAGNFASGLLNLVPQIKQLGTAVGEGVKTVKTAFKQPAELPNSSENFEDVK